MSLELLGLVTATGHTRISTSGTREATLTLYHAGTEVGTIELDLDGSPQIGDQYVLPINKKGTT